MLKLQSKIAMGMIDDEIDWLEIVGTNLISQNSNKN